jgi:hypothetical protein
MREILFRAKSIQTGEWIEGIPIKTHLGLFISFEENPHYCSQYGYMEIDDILMVARRPSASSRDFVTRTETKFGKMILSNIISEKFMLQSNMDIIKIVLILRKQNMSDSM